MLENLRSTGLLPLEHHRPLIVVDLHNMKARHRIISRYSGHTKRTSMVVVEDNSGSVLVPNSCR